jgi:alkylation response protein AidB-like acyl-CoA dehydrogenase
LADQSFLTWPFFEERHRQLAADLSEWTDAHLSDEHTDDLDQQCGELATQLGRAGWLRHCVPAAYGGVSEQLDVRTLCLIRETLSYHSGLADFVFAMQGLGSGALSLFAHEELAQRYLPRVAAGEAVAAFALSEPEAGSDAAALACHAEDHGDHYRVSGEKIWISNGGIADFYTLFVRTGEAPGARGVSALVVDADSSGLDVAKRLDVIAPHPLAHLQFDKVKVPKNHLLGEAGRGFKVAMAVLDIFRSTVGAASLGFARRALDEGLHRARTRKMFGATLADKDLAKAKLAEMALDIDASALLIYRAAWAKDQGHRVTREAAMAKLYATEAAQATIDKALQLHGGLGVLRGQKVEELYREIRALRIYEGASEVQKLVIASQLLSEG